ncbi:MAG: CHASE domain-containing protein, partial [Pseudomonadota bacterium]|nr:CHASE domain-containing protein [Pseudomonadota bacterium]
MDNLPLNHSGKEAQTDKDLKNAKFTFAANVILCLIICGLALAAMEYFNLKLNRQHAQAQTTEQLAEIRADLEFVINKNLALAQGVTSYISLNPDIDQASFSAYVDHLLHSENNIRNIGAAKDLTISLIHPLAGNEQALGLNYRENKDQAEAALKAIETDQIVLAGPLELIQGGVGLIGRQAVYQQSNNHLWGIISFVLDYPSVMESAIKNRDLDL